MPFDLEPTEEQTALRDTLHEFAAEVLRPRARECDDAGATPDDIRRQVHEIGIAAPVDETHGGGGALDAVTYCIAAEELAWGSPGIASQVLGSGLAAVILGAAGTDEQKSSYLGRFVEAEPPRSFIAVGERFVGADLGSLQTRIDGDKVIGEKYGVVDAEEASLGLVVGRAGDGLATALVEGAQVEVVKAEDKMGLRAAPTHVVRLDGPAEALPAGPELHRSILWTKLLTGALALGCARASFEHASQYAVEREAFGKPIGAFQGISFKIADMGIAVDAARVALWHAAWKIDQGVATQGDLAQAVGQCLTTAVHCGDDGVQVLGGHGYIRDHPVEMWFRDAVTLSVFDAPETLGDLSVAQEVLG